MKRGKIHILGLLLLTLSCGQDLPSDVALQLSLLPVQVDYNFHVKPILSDRCFACHGPDADKREADLRLDVDHVDLAPAELRERILSQAHETMMPPPESNLQLSARDKAVLVAWIDQGAVHKPHWAFSKPLKPTLPLASKSNWAHNEIDLFVEAQLTDLDISPSPEAHREQLIRRLYFDLSGLPPSLPDLEKWLAEPEDSYYSDLVNHLLGKPAYGERMAAHWLDVARFADSEGYLDDFHHTFWPYRDWVIDAFNENLSYDQFIINQVGGDQIPDAREEEILATAFNRNHKQNSEGGVIPEEFRVDYVADRTNTLGAAFLGLTVACARCHDHKYDPISQEEYFQLFGFFNSTIERGDGIFSSNALEKGQMISNFESMNAGPVLALPDEEVVVIRDFLRKEIDDHQAKISQTAQSNTGKYKAWVASNPGVYQLEKIVSDHTVSHLTFDDMAKGKTTDQAAGNKNAVYYGDIKPVPGKVGLGVQSAADGQLVADGLAATFERMEPFTISFWINTPKEYHRAHVLYNGNNRIQGYRGWDIVADSGYLHFRLNHAHPYQSLDIRTIEKLPNSTWTHFVWTYDGSSIAEGMTLYCNGDMSSYDIKRNHLYRSAKPYLEKDPTVYMTYAGMIIGNRHYDQDFTGGKLDELQILACEADPVVAKFLYQPDEGRQMFRDGFSGNTDRLKEFFDLYVDPQLKSMRTDLQEIQQKEIITIDTVQEIMVMGDYLDRRPTYVLERGVYDAHGKRVQENVPESILPWPEGLPRNRYGLAQWLTHPDHPLTARVAVNQIWYLLFGRGIVETVEDFGNQGALPTHPQLLDWLAVDFLENEWNVKRLIKQMVSSATYRQSSRVRAELNQIDPDNRLLARAPRYRRSAEMVRDNILAASGLLNEHVGGPSAFPYQPDGLWREVMTHAFFPEYEVDFEDGLYRRSIYSFWKRNMPPPNMLIFDASSRSECQVRRQQSNTPLQALVLLNDPQMVEGCRAIAAREWRNNQGAIEGATRSIFRALTSRYPTIQEQALLMDQYAEELAYFAADQMRAKEFLDVGAHRVSDVPNGELAALARVSNTILNTTEAFYKN